MRRLLASLLALALAAGIAHARTAPNPSGHPTPGLDAVRSASKRAVVNSVPQPPRPVDLPAGATQIDSVYYDLLDMGSYGQHVIVTPDGTVHAAWQDDWCELAGLCPPNPNAVQPYPKRGMHYAIRDGVGAWTHVGKPTDPDNAACCPLTEDFGGFGTLDLTPTGRAVIAQHMNEEGCDLRSHLWLEDSPAASTWASLLAPVRLDGGQSLLFPQAAALPNGSFLIMAEAPRVGIYDEVDDFKLSRYASGGPFARCAWPGSNWASIAPTTLFLDGKPAFPAIAVASDGRAGVAVGDFGGNMYLIESSNGTFNAGTVTIRNLTNYTNAQVTVGDSTSSQYRAFVNCGLAYADTTPHVVWSELQARKVGANVEYFDWRSRIRHWSSTRGASTVYQVQAGEADHFDDVDNFLAGPLAGFNTISVDWPQVGFSPDKSEIYVSFLRFNDAQIDTSAHMGAPGLITGVGFADVSVCVARGAGAFSVPQNVTNTPLTDERFVSLAANNPGGRAHLLLQASATDQAGSELIGDRLPLAPVPLKRRIAYLEPKLNASLVAVEDGDAPAFAPRLAAWPNPARTRVTFAATSHAATGAVRIYTVDGRFVARAPFGAGGEAVWEGRDGRGTPMPTGVYFARGEGGDSNAGTRFLWIH